MNTETKKTETEQCNIPVVGGRFSAVIVEMRQSILDCLATLEKGYGFRKKSIENKTEIPMDILTVLLKQLKYEGKIELIMLFNECTGMPNGSGYCLSGNLN